MDYSLILTKFCSCMEDIGNALRTVLGTTQKYKFTEVANAINSCNQVYYLGTGTSFDVSSIPGYENLTEENFLPRVVSINSWTATSADKLDSCKGTNLSNVPSVTYNATTGKVTVNNNMGGWYCSGNANGSNYSSSGNITAKIELYLVKGELKTV